MGGPEAHEVGVMLDAFRDVVKVVVREADGGESGEGAECFGNVPQSVMVQIQHLR